MERRATTPLAIAPRSPSLRTAPESVLSIRNLTVRYGDQIAVDGVDLDVARGEILGILGRNGAGKTTTVECAQGLRRPTSGSVSILGVDVVRHRARLGSRIGSQLQDSSLPDRLRVGEALRLFADDPTTRDEAAAWGLDELWSTPFGALSGGQQQRLFIALALVNHPEVVFLDELTQGLDPIARQEVWANIRRIRDRGTTVVLVTHFADEAEALCDRVVVMVDGALCASGTPRDLTERLGPGVGLRFSDAEADIDALRSLPGVRDLTVSGRRIELRGDHSMIAHVGAHLVARHRVPTDLTVIEPTLEDALFDVMARSTRDTDPS